MATAGESYALGGWNSVPATAKEVYDPGSGTWATLAPLPANRTDLAVVSWRGRILAIGGASTFWGETQGSVWIYDPLIDAWSEGPSMPTPRQQIEAAVVGSTVYVPGGAVSANAGSGVVESLKVP